MFNDLMWAVYWIEVIGTFPLMLGRGVFFLAIIGFFVVFLCALSSDGFPSFVDKAKRVKKAYSGLVAGTIIFVVVMSLFPSKQTMYIMLGLKTTDNVVNSDVGKKVQKIVNGKLDEYLNLFESKK